MKALWFLFLFSLCRGEETVIEGPPPYTYTVGDEIELRCYNFNRENIGGYSWLVNSNFGNSSRTELIERAVNGTLKVNITSWMINVETSYVCRTEDVYRRLHYGRFYITAGKYPKLIEFEKLSETAVKCVMEGQPRPEMAIFIEDGEDMKSVVNDSIEDYSSIVYTWSSPLDSNTRIFCSGTNTLGKIEEELKIPDKVGIFGPKPFSYGIGDIINITCRPPKDYVNPKFKWIIYDIDYQILQESDFHEFESMYSKTADFVFIQCLVNSTEMDDTFSSTFEAEPLSGPIMETFRVIENRLECTMKGNPAPALRMFSDNGNELHPPPAVTTKNHVSKLTWVNPHLTSRLKYYCVGVNKFGIKGAFFSKQEEKKKAKFDEFCKHDYDCEPNFASCINNTCQCDKEWFVERRYNFKEECVRIRMLSQRCEYTVQCEATDVNAGCIGGICKCFSPYKKGLKNKCWRTVTVGEFCNSNDECQNSVRNSECRFMFDSHICTCKANYRYVRGQCVLHIFIPGSGAMKTISIAGLVGISMLFSTVLFVLLISVRVIYRRRQQNSYLETVLRNQNLSLSNQVPLKNPPAPEIKKKKPISTEPHTPVELHVPQLKKSSENVASEDPIICVPESIPFIKDDDNSIC